MISKRGQRNFLARFEHKCVSARERERKHPHRHHRRKIKRRDADADAERLMHRLAIDAAREIFERVAHEQASECRRRIRCFRCRDKRCRALRPAFCRARAKRFGKCDRSFLRPIGDTEKTNARARPAACRANSETHRPRLRPQDRHVPSCTAGTSAMTSPRDGLKTGVVSTPEISRHSPPINAGTEVINPKSQNPNHREAPSLQTSILKREPPNSSYLRFPVNARENQMQFPRFAKKLARVISQLGFRSSDHAEEMFCFLCFLYAAANDVAKILFRNALVCFAIVRADARTAANQLIDQPIVRRIARYLL